MSREFGIFTSMLLVSLLVAGQASATVIVLDNFTSNNGAVANALGGRTPQDVNTPGDTWHFIGTQGDGTITTDGARNIARPNADNGYRTSINGFGSANMLVSSTLRYEPNFPNTDNLRGVGVGFWSNLASANGFTHFTGLQIGTRGDTLLDFTFVLKLLVNGATVATDAYTGSLTGATDYHDLSYQVNTVTGAVSNIILDGDSYSFSQTPFSVANTYSFGYVSTGYSGGARGYFDFVQLEIVPEPASVALLTIGLASVSLRRRCR